MFLLRPTQMCWICGKAVTPETFERDEHGSTVHSKCQAARLALASASYAAARTGVAPSQRIKPMAEPARNILPEFLKTGS